MNVASGLNNLNQNVQSSQNSRNSSSNKFEEELDFVEPIGNNCIK